MCFGTNFPKVHSCASIWPFPQENIDNCEGVTCPEFQQCVDLVDDHQCRCPPGLTGPSCDQDIDEYEDYDDDDDDDDDE